MNWFEKRSKAKEDSELNLSPLLDIVFILLIFFVVTTTFARETGVDVNKPKASSASQRNDKILKVAITREGSIHVFEKQVDIYALLTVLKRERAREPNVELIIVADSDSLTQRLVEVIDTANLAGIRQTSIATIRN